MQKSLFTRQHAVLIEQLIMARKDAGMTQQALADKLGRPQSFVAKYETGERRLDVIEFLEITGLLGKNPNAIIREVESAR